MRPTGQQAWMYDGSLTPQGYLVRTLLRSQRDDFFVPSANTSPGGSSCAPVRWSRGPDWCPIATRSGEGGYSRVVFNTMRQHHVVRPGRTPSRVGLQDVHRGDGDGAGGHRQVYRIIAANGRLFVLTKGKSIQPLLLRRRCPGQSQGLDAETTPVASPNDVWKTRAARLLAEGGVDRQGRGVGAGPRQWAAGDELLAAIRSPRGCGGPLTRSR